MRFPLDFSDQYLANSLRTSAKLPRSSSRFYGTPWHYKRRVDDRSCLKTAFATENSSQLRRTPLSPLTQQPHRLVNGNSWMTYFYMLHSESRHRVWPSLQRPTIRSAANANTIYTDTPALNLYKSTSPTWEPSHISERLSVFSSQQIRHPVQPWPHHARPSSGPVTSFIFAGTMKSLLHDLSHSKRPRLARHQRVTRWPTPFSSSTRLSFHFQLPATFCSHTTSFSVRFFLLKNPKFILFCTPK